MGYIGTAAPIPLGQSGLHTDDPSEAIPPSSAVTANNISLYTSKLQKSGGSTPYSLTALTSAIVSLFDWWPTATSQRLIAATSDGKVWRDSGDGTWTTSASLNSIEVQSILFSNVPAGGSFTVAFGGHNSSSIAAGASVSAAQTAIQAITGLASATVSLPYSGSGYLVRMAGTVGSQALITTNSSSLTDNSTQTIIAGSTPSTGAFTLSYNGNATTSLAYNSTSSVVQTALEALPGLASVTVSGSLTSSGFTVVMTGVTTPLALVIAANTTAQTLTVTPAGTTTIAYAKVATGKTAFGTLTPDMHMSAGGAESAGRNRKLFIYTGTTPIQVMSGDGSNLTDIANPASDWASNFPTYGFIYNGHHFCFGNANDRHRLYISTEADHEDFRTSATDGSGASSFSVFSGEGDGLVSAAIYKGTLLLFKKPFGVYRFDWNGGTLTDPANVSITKYSDSFGIASPHSPVTVLDDLMCGANTNSIFSLKATQAFGGLEAGDVLSAQRVRDYVRTNFNVSGAQYMHAIFYPEKEIAMFTTRTESASNQNAILMLDVSRQNPRLTIELKDQPTCLALRKDSNFVPRPIYGSDDGLVYQMDQDARNVNGASYLGEFQTPNIDFSYMDGSLAEKTKLFDFLHLTFAAVGQWSFYVDVYVDGIFLETITYVQTISSAVLDSFVLDIDRLGGVNLKAVRKPLHGSGKNISFRIWNNGLNQYFSVERIVVGFRVSGEQNKGSKT